MRKYSWLTPVSILVFVLVTLIFLSPLFIPKGVSWPIKQKLNLGLDLKGGTQIVLRVVTDSLALDKVDAAVDNNIRIIRNRIDQYGIAEPIIQKRKTNEILVQLPGVSDPIAAQDLVKKAAVLQFQLVAPPEEAEKFITALDTVIQDSLSYFPELAKIDAADKAAEQKGSSAAADSTKQRSGVFKSLLSSSENNLEVRAGDVDLMQDVLKNPNFAKIKPKGYDLALSAEDDTPGQGNERRVIYVLNSNIELEGRYIDRASWEIGSSEDPNPNMANKPYISLEFDRDGARKFANVTGDNIQQRLAIVVDDAVYSAPVIQDRIPDGKATISGQFTNDQAKSLAILLDNESLSAKFEPNPTINQVSATLGTDSIKSGLRAGLIGIIAVFLYMILFYNLSGVVTDFVLIFNVGFILAAMTIFGGTLTMPGIAGIILSIGMSVDANVLIFERIREELAAGKTPRTAVDAGFKRASVTIWDSNITTVIAAFVLYQFGTGPVRGFALTLTIGIIGSMFCAIVFLRYIMEKTMLSPNKTTISI